MRFRAIRFVLTVGVLLAMTGCGGQTEDAKVSWFTLDPTGKQITVELSSYTTVSVDSVNVTETSEEVRIKASVPRITGNRTEVAVMTSYTFTLESPLGERQVIDDSDGQVVRQQG